ncbi:sirohydrochlorin chelatase [Calothrix sp. UHCC 0171]|uniref:sirohydrochlorin chelatase n=1 Tax=Calothrix sp. UHCC 0171 TaxID=3110245 RepID=UPI002B22014D|nr:sirohydrochlorin chelatase [Calothrix sp. UHCC 0171]MEA5569812.1 sirohydrochlorin chelatase [Calothrix sp. UHCC 0171]
MSSAYLLISHGSRDPRPNIAMQQLARKLSDLLHVRQRSQLENSIIKNQIGTAYLELQLQPLHRQICDFAKQIVSSPQQPLQLKILPLFLLLGTHVMEDIPAEIALAKQELAKQILGENIIIELLPYLGSHANLGKLIATQLMTMPAEKYILIAHGSRRPGFQKPIEKLISNLQALNLDVTPAYWAVSPNLESQVRELVATGNQRITIAPYFLFPGGIPDAIATTVKKLQLQFPGVSLNLTEPLGMSAKFADLIWELL